MFTLYCGNDRFAIFSKLKKLEENGFSYFHGDLSELISLVSSTGLFENNDPKKIIVNIETSSIDFDKKFIKIASSLNKNDNIVFVYYDSLRPSKAIKEIFSAIENFSIKDNKEIFALIDAIFGKDEKKSLELTTLLLQKYDAFYIQAMIFYQLKNILYGYYHVGALKSLHPFVSTKTTGFMKNLTRKSSVSVLKALVELDYKLKSTNLGSDALYSVIYYILSV